MAEGTGRRGVVLAAALTAFAFTAALYRHAVGLPFYSDDLLQILWVRATPALDCWRSVSPYGDYRPLQFSLWKALQVLGILEPAPVHALNLLAHALCGTLVGALAARHAERPVAVAALAAALFAAFPFAVDAVAWASSFSYPLALALALGGVLVGTSGPQSPCRSARYGASLVLVALAGFAHEAGVAVGPAAALSALLLARPRKPWRAMGYLAASVLPLACILRFSPAGTAYSLAGANWGDSAMVALQALAYPVAPAAQWASRGGLDARAAMALMGLAAVAALAACAHRRMAVAGDGKPAGPWPLFVFGLAWAILWSAIPLATQRFDWLRDPPRVLYPSAAGTAMVWTAGLAGLAVGRRAALCLAVAAVVTCAALVPAVVFVWRAMGLYARAGDVLWQAIGAADGPSPVLLVNLPGRITTPTRVYPLGHEGVIPMPPPSNADLLVQVHTGRAGAALERAAGAILPPLPYGVELAGLPLAADDIRAAARVMVTAYRADGTMALQEAGAVFRGDTTGAPLAQLGDALLLLSADCHRNGDRITLTTTWRLKGDVGGTPTVFAHLLDASGRLVAQADGDPIRGLYPLAQWDVGETVRDVRVFDGAPPGLLTVAFGVWNPMAGTRWPTADENGARLTDDAVRCPVAPRGE
ncbi:MAG: hypothetical protein QHH80_02965 [Anaerolineae bacterium]|nr:hypothetical protein [Anaerolineae bacterium]